MHRLAKNKLAMLGLIIIALMVLLAIAAPRFAPYDYMAQDYTAIYSSPSREHLLGTDGLGRDILSRLIFGTRQSLRIGVLSVAIAAILGTIMGSIAGYYGGTIDNVLMRILDITFTLEKGKTLGVVGESGCGKSTLGRTVLHLPESTDGRIVFEGEDVTRVDKKKLHQLREKMQIIFQDPFASLNPRMSVRQTIMEPLILKGGMSKEQMEQKTAELMETVGLPERLADAYPHELDGGLGQIIGSAVGPGLGVWIMNQYGTRYSFYISAAFSLAAMIAVLLFQYAAPPKSAQARKITLKGLVATEILDFSFVSGCYSFLNGVVASFLVLFAAERGILDVSLYFTVSAVFLFAARPISGKLVDRFGLKYVIYPAICMTILSILMLITMRSVWMLLLSAAVRALAQGALQPSLQAACIQKVDKERSGAATGTYYLGADIGQSLGPILGGFIAGLWGYTEIFYFCILLILVACLVFFLSTRQKKA